MFPKLFGPAPEFPDFELDHDQITTLISLLAAYPEVSFPQLDGLAIGLAITKNAPITAVPALLDIQDAAPELLELITQYAQDVQNTIALEMLSPRLENVETLQTFSAWLSGVGQAIALDPVRGVPLLNSGSVSARSILSMVLAFAPMLPTAPQKQIRDQQAERNRVLKGFKGETADDLLQRIYSLIETLMDLYNGSAPPTSSTLTTGGTVRRTEPKIGPNEPCPCGSGKKYKKCHGVPGRA